MISKVQQTAEESVLGVFFDAVKFSLTDFVPSVFASFVALSPCLF